MTYYPPYHHQKFSERFAAHTAMKDLGNQAEGKLLFQAMVEGYRRLATPIEPPPIWVFTSKVTVPADWPTLHQRHDDIRRDIIGMLIDQGHADGSKGIRLYLFWSGTEWRPMENTAWHPLRFTPLFVRWGWWDTPETPGIKDLPR